MSISHPLPLYFSGVMTFSIVRFSGEASYKFHFGRFHSFMRGGEEATVFPTFYRPQCFVERAISTKQLATPIGNLRGTPGISLRSCLVFNIVIFYHNPSHTTNTHTHKDTHTYKKLMLLRNELCIWH